jgi:DNA-binding NtrC family response regulator
MPASSNLMALHAGADGGAHATPALAPTAERWESDAGARSTIQVLVVEPDAGLRDTCTTVLRRDGYQVTACADSDEAQALLVRRAFDIVVTEAHFSGATGMDVLSAAHTWHPATLVVVMAENPSVEASIDALREGAWDYLPKPFSAAHLQVLIGRAAPVVLAGRERRITPPKGMPGVMALGASRASGLEILGTAPEFRRAIELAARVASTDAAVLIRGESGTGKELVARFIHANSHRATRPFVTVNCSVSPEAVLEAELFGHQAQAFAGPGRTAPGLLGSAEGGTLFLDELLELPKSAQNRLLRVLQDGAVQRVGADAPDGLADVRFISATNGDPERAREEGRLREDLYYRLRVVPIDLPPLRERPGDIPLLADFFLAKFWRRRGGRPTEMPELTTAAIQALSAHPWRGNVRELQNVIEHVAVLAQPGKTIGQADLALRDGGEAPAPSIVGPQSMIPAGLDESYHAARDRVIAQFETQYLDWLVKRAGGNLSKAARVAGVDRTTLYRVMERHGLQRRYARSSPPDKSDTDRQRG